MAVDRKHLEKNWAEALKILESMKEEELIVLIEEAQLVRARKEAERVKNARSILKEKAKELGVSIEELFGGPKSKSTGIKRSNRVAYLDDDGKPWKRAKAGWTETQKKKYKTNLRDHTL
jgi:hypothetical protein